MVAVLFVKHLFILFILFHASSSSSSSSTTSSSCNVNSCNGRTVVPTTRSRSRRACGLFLWDLVRTYNDARVNHSRDTATNDQNNNNKLVNKLNVVC